MIKTVLVTNIPAPYREKLHELIAEKFQHNYTVIYCAEKEADRTWKFNLGNYKKIFLSKYNKTTVHSNHRIWRVLNRINPEVVILDGFYPTMLYAFAWCMVNKKKPLVFTDGTLNSENRLSIIHKLIRKIVFSKTNAFIGVSDGAQALYKSYDIEHNRFFRSYLCVDNSQFKKVPLTEKKYELMFSARFIDLKLPFFFVEIAKQVKEKLGYCRVLLIGSGELKEDILKKLDEYGIDYDYPGFVETRNLPEYYSKAKILLFPTLNDTWGVVANEAMAAGLPVITCENAGVAHDLVIQEETGFVLPVEKEVWAEKVVNILKDQALYEKLSANAHKHVQKYNFQNAAKGVIDAIQSAVACLSVISALNIEMFERLMAA
ncbi:glycosyltransferase family 4 protein [Terrimonas pollutisoli]|uniref:glycosyltransferase family 4 protein n=1 Tax=Terrimonas pollutisoli TaxID=3034147 RepID=UPI0023EB91AB|nr:glycosyltransferase family 4 protein [Terrimonas sp. H1YJ31]